MFKMEWNLVDLGIGCATSTEELKAENKRHTSSLEIQALKGLSHEEFNLLVSLK